MKLALLFNPDAGEGAVLNDIAAMLVGHGHAVACALESEAEAARLLQTPCDAVVAAGGDGTVAVVARLIAGRRLPLGILPIGTANNIALTLGIDGPLDEVIDRWRSGRTRSVDCGTAHGAWGRRLFIESVGVGLMPVAIADAQSQHSPGSIDRRLSSLARTAQIYRETLSRLRPQPWTIDVDGTTLDGEFLLIEALNIRFIGPNLVFAPDVDPSDGLLSVTFAREEHREQIDEYLRRRMEGTDYPLVLPSVRGRRIEIEHPGCFHVDDQVYQSDEAGRRVSVHVGAAALDVLS